MGDPVQMKFKKSSLKLEGTTNCYFQFVEVVVWEILCKISICHADHTPNMTTIGCFCL